MTTSQRFEVSYRIHEEFDNGEYYYTFHGKRPRVPPNKEFQPSSKFHTCEEGPPLKI